MSETTKILVVSDVHGRMRDLRWVLQNETADAMFYLGDGLYDLNGALELNKTPCRTRSTAWQATAMWGIRNPPRVWPPLQVCCFSTPTAIITA